MSIVTPSGPSEQIGKFQNARSYRPIIPTLAERDDLTPVQKRIAIILERLSGEKPAYISVDKLAEFAKCCRRTVQTALSVLEHLGLIERWRAGRGRGLGAIWRIAMNGRAHYAPTGRQGEDWRDLDPTFDREDRFEAQICTPTAPQVAPFCTPTAPHAPQFAPQAADLHPTLKIRDFKSKETKEDSETELSKRVPNIHMPCSSLMGRKPEPGMSDGPADVSPSAKSRDSRPMTAQRHADSHARFESFWLKYPKRTEHFRAGQAWMQLPVIEQLHAIADVEARNGDGEWLEKDGRYAPTAYSYVMGRRWEDGPLDEQEREWAVLKAVAQPHPCCCDDGHDMAGVLVSTCACCFFDDGLCHNPRHIAERQDEWPEDSQARAVDTTVVS